MKKIIKITLGILICSGVGYLSSIVTRTSLNTWYPLIAKPSFNPPNYVFPIVWPLLYILMGIAVGMVWNRFATKERLVKNALILFGIQLVLNALWSILFFGMQNPRIAFFELLLLLLFVLLSCRQFYKISPLAAYLLIPYILWLSFAAVLNYSIWTLNS
ncbi:TspO/MBR family protein [Flavobacterium sp. NKUCC04_CG]|uniref:TspO/MBR family protein n=1 Tax=Flavobacterium sp. NKUCC04_CG TaxID=2842121 RepID=UPI001C5A7E89|nr:TspO/MBR family protein [Flavobacterium sp. NKUCC04_CG]MBW3519009.1 tryptophan-rich sensory protein [Flavobacterium sp. NKUCC04_CG]